MATVNLDNVIETHFGGLDGWMGREKLLLFCVDNQMNQLTKQKPKHRLDCVFILLGEGDNTEFRL